MNFEAMAVPSPPNGGKSQRTANSFGCRGATSNSVIMGVWDTDNYCTVQVGGALTQQSHLPSSMSRCVLHEMTAGDKKSPPPPKKNAQAKWWYIVSIETNSSILLSRKECRKFVFLQKELLLRRWKRSEKPHINFDCQEKWPITVLFARISIFAKSE